MKFLFFLARIILHRRYRIRISGFDVFDTDAPVVVFPNHPALVDPIMMLSEIGRKKILSPVMTETYMNTPGIGPILRKLKTIPVGDIQRGGNAEDVKSAFVGIKNALQNGQNVLLYPSGHIYVQSFEDTMGKKMAYEIVGILPAGTRIIVARTKGLWGSMWGKAYTGNSPELLRICVHSIWYIFANFFFFVPKRKVSIEYHDMTDELKKWYTEGLDTFNQKLQDYYNEGGNEVCRFIPHYFYHDDVRGKTEPKKISGSLAELAEKNDIRESDVPGDTLESVIEIIAKIKKLDPKNLHFSDRLILDLHADSLDMAEMKSIVQSRFTTASNPPITAIKTVGDLGAMAIGILRGEEKLPEISWKKTLSQKIHYQYRDGDTLLSLMKENFSSQNEDVFIYDAVVGAMTRKDFLLKSLVVGTYLKKYTKENLGIMMPALASTSLLLSGVYLSGKLPVMLNWTVGERSFAHCMEFAGLDTILTSRKFYEKIQTPWLAQYEQKMVFVEDMVRDISLSTKIIAIMKMKLGIWGKANPYAVMLFTSGSESLPKAVRLTQENILSDIAGALEYVPFQEGEVFMGILPPFHSFGFTINTICPLILPLRAAYSPDPNDARTIAKIISHTHASILAGTPTFLRMILSSGEKSHFESLKYAVVGAERCGYDVFALASEKAPGATILEGYGITECSPIVTVNPLEKQKRGSTGKFLSSLSVAVRNIDNTHKSINTGEQGMLYVSGPSIFGGYLDTNLESPFEEWDGKQWYKTGDLGYLDKEGYFFITGRLKRFVKIAGEMISLPFIESILLEKYGKPDVTTLAIEAKEDNGVVTIVAFTTFDVSVDELNKYMHTHGASNIVKISCVEKIPAIPLLGTGKTDYKELKSHIS